MAVGIALALAAMVGIIYGIIKKNKPIALLSAVALFMVIAVWMYFYQNPY